MGLDRSRAAGAFVPLCWMFTVAPAAADTAPIWTGAYAGVHGGLTRTDLELPIIGTIEDRNSAWGIHTGYNLAKGRLIIGVEADANFGGADLEGSLEGLATGTVETKWSGSIRARMGIITGPALLYGTVGYAKMDTDIELRAISGEHAKGSETFSGLVYGIGAEGYVMPNVSVRLEALRYDYSVDYDDARPFVDMDETVLRAGLTFRLN